MTVKEAAQRLHCSPSTVYQLCECGRLPHSRIGLGRGVIRIAEGDIEGLLLRGRVELPANGSNPSMSLKHIRES
jgi:excisionase family DNA binding protein